MEENKAPDPASEELDDVNSLEGGTEEIIDATGGSSSSTPKADDYSGSAPKQKGFKKLLKKFNVYLLMFVFILIIAIAVIAIAYFQSKSAETTSTIKTQNLTDSALKQVANSDANVGNSQQVLNVLSSAVFAGKVLVRQDLEVAGSLKIGGTVGLNNLAVSGALQSDSAKISKDFSVGGNSAVQGSSTVGKNLQVSGTATFGGALSAPQITVGSLQINNDLTLTRHLIIGGATPKLSSGPALGGGGSSSISGSDTAGTISVNVGSGAPAGCFATITFSQKYNGTPRVVLTPVGSGGGAIDYYVNRSSTSFSVCDSTPPPAGASFAFDYFIVE